MTSKTFLPLPFVLVLACGGSSPPAAQPAASSNDGAAALARFKAATGGAGWDAMASAESHGTLSTGGMSGSLVVLEDTRTGRSLSRYTLGSMNGAEGYDGKVQWSQDIGGEVTTPDAPDVLEGARTSAWLTQLGYWYPTRAPATFGAVSERVDGGRKYRVIEATPAGGRPVALWLDEATGLLTRTVTREGADTVTASLDDYRDDGGVRMPFHIVADRTDVAGRTDPRQRTEIRWDSIALNPKVEDAAFAVPKMAPTARIADGSGVTQVPFELVNNHIYVNATIGGEKVHVIVDTGGANVLMPASAKRIGLTSEGKMAGHGVGDEVVDVGLAHAKDVQVGGAVLSTPIFAIMDLGPFASLEGVECDGLVGFEMFRRFGVTIDYAARVLTLTEPAKFHPPAGAHVIPFELAEHIPIVSATLDGVPVRISVDTGSRSSLTMHSPFVRKNGLVERYAAAPERVTGWGVGGASMARPARLGTLLLGDLAVHDIAGDLYMGDKGAFSDPDLAGNLGAGVLRRFTVAFDYDAKRMYLAPNADLPKPDPFDRAGVWMTLDGDALKMVALAPGGAALAAGVAVGDRVTAVDGEPIAKRTLWEWRQRFAGLPPGTKVKLGMATGTGTPARPAREVSIVLANAIPEHAVVR